VLDALQLDFGQYSLGWFLLSVVLGGTLGAILKYIFEVRLPESLKSRQEVEEKVAHYSYPLLQAASDVELRIETVLTKGIRSNWLGSDVVQGLRAGGGFLENTSEGLGYFYLSTLYVFARYFAWIEILRRETGFLEFPSGSKSKELYQILHRINNAFRYSGLWQLSDEERQQANDYSRLHRHLQSAIGEIMIVKQNGKLDCISFLEFVSKYKGSQGNQFRFWLHNLEEYFEGLSNIDVADIEQDITQTREYRVLRLIALQYWFYRLTNFLDPKFEKVQRRDERNQESIRNRLPAAYRIAVEQLPVD
jgi:hypothetical protein